MSDLILVRHGETVGNSAVRLFGITDIELSDIGKDQMKRAGEALKDIRFEKVYTSPLKRSVEGAAILSGYVDEKTEIINDFSEIDFGAWEGLSMDEAQDRYPELFKSRDVLGADFRFPEGDSKREFFERVSKAAVSIFSKSEYPALAVLHKGVIKGVLAGLLGVSVDDMGNHPIELGSIHRLKKSPGGWELISTNETAHLGDTRIPSSV